MTTGWKTLLTRVGVAVLAIALVIVAVKLLFLPGNGERRAAALLRRGEAKARAGDMAGAIADYTAVVEMPDASAEARAKALLNRGIAVAPRADVARCAEQIGRDYVVSYRPSPADMVSYDFDPARVAGILRKDLTACRKNDCHVDITLKDVETVGKDPSRVRKWVETTRRVIDEVYG